MALAPLADKWRAFGWTAREVDGHDLAALRTALDGVPDGSGRPRAVIAHTVKGKGVSFMEGKAAWHGKAISDEDYAKAMAELGGDR